MRIITIILPLLLIAGCDGHYRYPCQDPANWGKLECNNDVCQAEGTCTAIVLARSGTLDLANDVEDSQDTENFAPTDESGINTTTCVPALESAAVVNYAGKGEQPRDFRVKNKMVQEPDNDAIDSDTIEAIDQATQAQEVPLTMNTVVDTAAHNAATK